MLQSRLVNSALALLTLAAFASCSSQATSRASFIPNASQSGSRALLLQSAKTDGRLSRLWDKIMEAHAHPVSDLPRKGKPINAALGATLPRDLVDLMDDVVFRNQPRDRGIRLLTLDQQAKATTSRARSLQVYNPAGSSACIDWIYFQFYALDQNGLPFYDDGDPLIFAVYARLPICLEFDPNWLANFLANLQPIPAGGGTSAGCALYASNCYLIDGDYDNILYYATGEGGLYTSDPIDCQNTGSGWFSSSSGAGDGKPCSPWQVIVYDGEYIGQNQDVPNPQIPQVIFVSLAAANVNSIPILDGGHLYVWTVTPLGPQLAGALQAGPVGIPPLLRQTFYTQDPFGHHDPTLPVALGSESAAARWDALLNYVNTYEYNAQNNSPPAPLYAGPVLNSNTFVSALLFKGGSSLGEISKDTLQLTLMSGSVGTIPNRYCFGWEQYALLLQNFGP